MPAVFVEKRHDTFLAVMELPAELRDSKIPGLPKRRFVKTTGESDIRLAKSIARAYAIEWEAKIRDATGTADRYRRKLSELFPAGAAPIRTIESHELSDGRDIWLDKDTGDLVKDAATVIAEEAKPVRGGQKYAAQAEIDRWINYQSGQEGWTPKTADMKRSDVVAFAEIHPYVESVTLPAVKEWIMGLRDAGNGAVTIKRKLIANRQYWKHLQSLDKAPAGASPFNRDDLDLPKKSSRDDGDEARAAWTADDVVKLHKAARDGYLQTMRDGKPCNRQNGPNQTLADLIYLAAYTGGRIESLCSLMIEDIHFDATVKDEQGADHVVSYLKIRRDKSKAGRRDVPIHPALAPALRRLIGKRKSGYVLADLKPGKYGRRSHTIGNDFSDVKISLGFDSRYVFHSFRKTVSTLLQNAGVPEPTAANIVGHKIKTMTYGVYSAGASLPVKFAAIKKLRYPKGLKAE